MGPFVDLGRHVGIAVLAGLVSGIVVGGMLGRVAMRISGFAAGPNMIGVHTSNGNRVGDVTLEGTLGLILFIGVAAGLAGGALYAAVEPFVRSLRPWNGLVFGLGLLAAGGFLVLDPANFDFQRFGPPALNAALFGSLFVLFGVATAWLVDRLREASVGDGARARVLRLLAWLSLVPAALFLLTATFTLADAIGSTGRDTALIVIAGVLALGAATLARWRGSESRVGYAFIAVPVVLGLTRMLGSLPALLRGL